MLNFPKKPGRKPNEWTIKDIGPCKKLFKKFDFPSLKSNGSTLCTMQGANKLQFRFNSFECLYCEKFFRQKHNLKTHVNNIHNKIKENRSRKSVNMCRFCGKVFSQ